MTLFLDRRFDCGLEVPRVVKSVEYTNNTDTVVNGLSNEVLNHVVSIVTVAENVLTAEEHLKLGVFYILFNGTESLPGILVQES